MLHGRRRGRSVVRAVRVHLRRGGAAAPRRAGDGAAAVVRGRLLRGAPLGEGPVQREGRPALREPADRAVLRRGRRAGGHPGAALRRPGARAGLGRVGGDPVLRRADQHRPGRHPAGPAAGHHLDLRAGPGPQHGHLRRAAQRPAGRPPGRADAGHGRRRTGGRRGAQLAGARALRRQHGHPADAGRHHVLPGRQRRGRAVLRRRRPLPAGRGRGLRHRRRGRHDDDADRRADQGRRARLAAARGRHPLDDRRARAGRSRTPGGSAPSSWCAGSASSTACTRWTPTSCCRRSREVPIANVVDANYSAVVKARKALLPTASAYGGLHAELRRRAPPSEHL